MSEPQERAPDAPQVRRLSDAIREVKNALADRDDVVVEMREASRTRLEILAAELEDVIAEAPAEHPGFDFAISSGESPRFWIDAVAHVDLGRDRRIYRFLRDTRNGRVLLAESHDPKIVAEAVTRYVAERIVERQRDLDGAAPMVAPDPHLALAGPRPVTGSQTSTVSTPPPDLPKRSWASELLSMIAIVGLGGVVGAVVTLIVLRDRLPELDGWF